MSPVRAREEVREPADEQGALQHEGRRLPSREDVRGGGGERQQREREERLRREDRPPGGLDEDALKQDVEVGEIEGLAPGRLERELAGRPEVDEGQVEGRLERSRKDDHPVDG